MEQHKAEEMPSDLSVAEASSKDESDTRNKKKRSDHQADLPDARSDPQADDILNKKKRSDHNVYLPDEGSD